MFVCYSKNAHEYEQNKVEAYFIGRVLSFVDWIRTLIPGPYLVQDLMEQLTVLWIVFWVYKFLKLVGDSFCSLSFPLERHRTLVYDHSGVQVWDHNA